MGHGKGAAAGRGARHPNGSNRDPTPLRRGGEPADGPAPHISPWNKPRKGFLRPEVERLRRGTPGARKWTGVLNVICPSTKRPAYPAPDRPPLPSTLALPGCNSRAGRPHGFWQPIRCSPAVLGRRCPLRDCLRAAISASSTLRKCFLRSGSVNVRRHRPEASFFLINGNHDGENTAIAGLCRPGGLWMGERAGCSDCPPRAVPASGRKDAGL